MQIQNIFDPIVIIENFLDSNIVYLDWKPFNPFDLTSNDVCWKSLIFSIVFG